MNYYFTWKENGLTGDCTSLQSMAARYEESAKLMKKMAKEGFVLKKEGKQQLIKHSDQTIFESWGFINEQSPFKQLTLIKDNNNES